jgi:cytochrome c oxidase assembly protein subunit 11
MFAGFAVGMLGLAYASVPLYKLFCAVTGYGGTPKIALVAPTSFEVSDQVITVTLDANVMSSLGWSFKADIGSIKVNVGEESLALFHAKNTGSKAVTGTAAFNVTPFKAAQYISKTECFCFTEQRLEAGEEMPMLTSFYIDPEISTDPNTKNLKNIVLSYTFYPSLDSKEESETAMLGDPINVE